MHLLVTRPEPDAMRTASRLSLLGHEVFVEPMLAIEFHHPPKLDRPGAILVTSRNGIRAVQRWPEAIDWRGLPVFAVGGATAEAAEAAGFAEVHVALGAADDLASLVLRSFSPSDGVLLYPAAVDRSGEIEAELTARGYEVHLIEAYRARAAERLSGSLVERLQARSLDGLIFFSERTAATFSTLAATAGLAPALAEVGVYALSEQVAAPLRALRPGSVHVAPQPSEDALLALVPPPTGQ